jgi:hypothetical protein
LPDGIFQTKNPNWGKFGRVLQSKMLIYFMAIWSTYFTAIWYILWLFGIFYGYIVFFPILGLLYHEKTDNHVLQSYLYSPVINKVFIKLSTAKCRVFDISAKNSDKNWM